MSAGPAELSKRYPCDGLHFEVGAGGLTKATIETAVSRGELYLHGAHVTSWQPVGHEPVLWMSRHSNFAPGKAIRGGVPICFPWFGSHPSDPSAPAHGYARITEWELTAAGVTEDDSIGLTLQTHIEPFGVDFRVEFGRVLTMALTTALPLGAAIAPRFEDALHTYFSVGDIRQVSIAGLETSSYIDKVDNASEKAATAVPIEFSGETDRVYLQTEAPCVLADRVHNRRITVSKSGSKSTVVWNPWINKSQRMSDFGDNEWPEMVCIETANIGSSAIVLAPGQSHTTTAVIEVG